MPNLKISYALLSLGVLVTGCAHSPRSVETVIRHIAHPGRELSRQEERGLEEEVQRLLPQERATVIRLSRDPDTLTRVAAVIALREQPVPFDGFDYISHYRHFMASDDMTLALIAGYFSDLGDKEAKDYLDAIVKQGWSLTPRTLGVYCNRRLDWLCEYVTSAQMSSGQLEVIRKFVSISELYSSQREALKRAVPIGRGPVE